MNIIPKSAAEITPEWLTSALQSTEIILNARITACNITPIGEGIGLVSQLHKIEVKYDPLETKAPASLVAKLPSNDPQNDRYWGTSGRSVHQKEIAFYKNIAPNIPLRTPHCYFGDANWEDKRAILLLEDLSSQRPSDQLQGCSASDAEIVVRDWAQFNAAFWNSDRLQNIPNLSGFTDGFESLQSRFDNAWENYIKNFRHELPSQIIDIGNRILGEGGNRVRNRLDQSPKTLCHGDLRLDNFFYLERESRISVIDWSGLRSGPGIWDVSHFISQSLEPDVRKSCEHSLLQTYHQTLIEHGVVDYTFEQIQYDYRLSMLNHLQKLIRSYASFAIVNERHKQALQAIRRRIPPAVIDNYDDDLITP